MIALTSIDDLIADSLQELMQTIPLMKITVSDIVKNCSISRRTFYNHFQDKYAVIHYIYKKYGDLYFKEDETRLPWRDACINALEQMQKNQRFYKNAICYTGQNSLLSVIFEDSFQKSYDRIQQIAGKEEWAVLRFQLAFFFSGLVTSGENWILEGMRESPEQLTDQLIQCMPHELRSYLLK